MLLKKETHDVYIGLGTNLGAKRSNLYNALEKMEKKIGIVISCSAFYETSPVGFESNNQFLNAVCCIQTTLEPLAVLNITQNIEKEMGRGEKSEEAKYKDRIIDLDILLYDDLSTQLEELILPHPHLHEREFVLTPLVEIADELLHPTLNKTMAELLNAVR